MARLRRKAREVETEDDFVDSSPEPADVRHEGPWDSTEKSVADDPSYVDLGALIVRGDEGFTLQLPADNDNGDIGSVVMVAEGAALELRAFAATRSGGLWDEVRADIAEEVTRLDGESEVIVGPYGAELHVSVPAKTPDGQDGVQPSRIIGVEGPRWLLRATLLGAAAMDTDDGSLLMRALRDVIVVRGAEPRIPREALLLTVPPDAVPTPPTD